MFHIAFTVNVSLQAKIVFNRVQFIVCGLWNVTSGTRLPYFESQFRVSPFRSPLTWRGSASPRCAWTPLPDIAEFPAAEGTLTHRKPLGSIQLYFSQLLELLCHILSLFFSPLFILPTDGRSLDIRWGEEAEDQRAALRWSTRAPGAQGARRTPSECQ